ncbi:hypothetical protein Pcinc_003433 [Petrolisthes cinctipes]|uniref:Uncharacterized protein n=1 Tax=Petrolisthes cinctipes TaxID=88211 RepID=A0AAE1GNQ3_PETCI|nr:hypothetical protein Pcinc_003433 [Petrolisthes cinctipes]
MRGVTRPRHQATPPAVTKPRPQPSPHHEASVAGAAGDVKMSAQVVCGSLDHRDTIKLRTLNTYFTLAARNLTHYNCSIHLNKDVFIYPTT